MNPNLCQVNIGPQQLPLQANVKESLPDGVLMTLYDVDLNVRGEWGSEGVRERRGDGRGRERGVIERRRGIGEKY